MLPAIAVVVVAMVAVFAIVLILAAMKPDSFRIQRSATLAAPCEKIFPFINDFRNWRSWSPWERLDPNLKRNYGGADSGKGATYEWEGNKKVGKGRMEILDQSPPSKVTIQLDFIQPFEAHHTAEFALEPQGALTNVTWSMSGRQPFAFKVMTLFMSMDKMVGKDFESGLANLKALVEK